MSNPDDRKNPAEDDLFIQKARAIFDDSVDSLDGEAQSRLPSATSRVGSGFRSARKIARARAAST